MNFMEQIDKQLQAMEEDSKVNAARDAMPTCQCANLDERWICSVCEYSWFGMLTGCPKCGALIDLIDMQEEPCQK